MKFIFLPFLCIFLFISCNNTAESTRENNATSISNMTQLRHVVLFKFKETSSQKDVQKLEEAFAALPDQIPEIAAFEWGLNNSPEGLNKDFTHCFFVTFTTEKDRKVYLPHPAHKAFVDMLDPHVDDVLVLDYWTK